MKPTRKGNSKNKIHDLLSSSCLGWSSDTVSTFGPQFINTLGEWMWYIDGHHHTLKERGCSQPVALNHLAGFNCPETHKHKRNALAPVTEEKLGCHSEALLNITRQAYMTSKQWSPLREIILTLAINLQKYASILKDQNSSM